MYTQLWRLLSPFHRDYVRYLAGVAVRQALLVAGGYLLVWALKYGLQHAGVPEWSFVALFLIYDAGLLHIDIGLNTHFVSRLGYPLYGHLRTAALAKVFEMPLEWHLQQDTGTLIGKVNNGVGKVVQTAESIGRELAPSLIRTVLSLLPLLYFSPVTAPAILVALSIFLWLTIEEQKERHALRKTRYQNYNRDFGLFAESVQYVKPVVQFGQTRRILQRYEGVQQDIISDGMEETRIGNVYSWRRNLAISVAKRLCQGVWIWQCRQNILDAALVFYLNMITEELLNSFWSYASLLDRLYEGIEPTSTLVNLLEDHSALREESNALPGEAPAGVEIAMLNLNFSYDGGAGVMRDFTLRVQPGTVLGVVGPSGCGKTTIHNLLSRMFDVHEGKILVGGYDIKAWPLEQLRGLFSYVTQSDGVFLSETTLLDTIRFARPHATPDEVISAARAACIHDDIMRLPHGYSTITGQRGQTLSKGQQQRIALAQALIALDENRKVLVLDEFTSALDARTEQRVLQNLEPHFQGRTVIIIAHRLATVREVADRIVVISNGQVHEEGSHQELVSRNGLYAEMARLQAIA